MNYSSFAPSLTPLTLLAALALTGCNNDPAQDKTKATVSEAVTAAPTPAALTAASAKYTFSNASSKLEFVGAKVTKKHDGSFGTFTGTIDLVDGKPEKSSVTTEIDMASLTVDDPKLTGHLKTADFFDVEKFPKGRFTSTSITPASGAPGGATHTVTGNLELHGVSKSVSFPARIALSADAVEIDAEFAINRKDFGIVYPGMPDDLIKDDVLIKLDLHAGKATS
jgi:polyisoprenoid-binding protein YceI